MPITVIMGCLLSFLPIQSAAFADECSRIQANSEWNNSIENLVTLVEQKQISEAKELSKRLETRCSKFPMLMYLQGRIMEAEGNREEALKQFKAASEYTYEFAVSPDTSKRIWYARYELEHPDRTPESIQKLVDEKVTLQTELASTQKSIEDSQSQYGLQTETLHKRMESDYSAGLWTGAGIGIAGVLMLAAGLGINVSISDDEKYQKIAIENDVPAHADGEPDRTHAASSSKLMVTDKYIASWALIGVGSVAILSGAIVSGIFGYKLTHIDDNNLFSLQITPTNVGFSMTF